MSSGSPLESMRTSVPAHGPRPHQRGIGAPSEADGFLHVLSMRARVEGCEVSSFVHSALQEIRRYIERQHIQVQGPPFLIRRPAPRGRVDVEVGWPVCRTSGGGRLPSGDLPAGLIRSSRGPHVP